MLKSGTRPAIGVEARIALPVPPAELRSETIEIVLFDDANGNEAWNAGESWVSGWNGGRGSYYLTYLREARADLGGSRAGWNLCEGGVPISCSGDIDRTVIYISPVNEPVEK